jgi:hypothetical protein
MVPLNHGDRFAVSKGLLEFGRINDVNSPAATSTRVRKSAAVTNGKMEQRGTFAGTRREIHDIQLHIVWLNYVDLEIFAEERRSLTSLLRHLAGFLTISSHNISQRVLPPGGFSGGNSFGMQSGQNASFGLLPGGADFWISTYGQLPIV